MDKKDEIVSIISEISDIQIKKKETIMEQKYEACAKLRDKEVNLMVKLDEVSGVDDFYNKVYSTEKVLKHLELIVNSTEELKKLRPNFKEVFDETFMFDNYLVKLYKQRDEAYEAVLQLRALMD